ncbi:MAG TPA: peptidoglycan-binding domain-containing protein [Micromonospora sp.]
MGLGGGGGAPRASADTPAATAEVTRQTLVDGRTVDGELGYGPTTSLSSRLTGTLTALPDTGAVVRRGQALFRVDDRPVTLLYGALPAYRALGPGDEGADVAQLEKNLAALGYTGFTVDDEYTSSTADAVRRWQEKLGLDETGRVALGQVVFAAGPVRVDSVAAAAGESAGPGQQVLAYTGTARFVTVQLDVADQRLAKKGARVRVLMPDGTPQDGTVQRVYSVVEDGGDGPDAEPDTKIEALVSFADPKAGERLDAAAVDVVFTAATREGVLTVPVAALVALAEGGYGVEVVDGRGRRYVRVETGLFADGRVEVSGDGLTEGATVVVPA